MTAENLEQKTRQHLPVKIRMREYLLNPIYITQKMIRVPAQEFNGGMAEKKMAVAWSLMADSPKWVTYTILATYIVYDFLKR
ncbi:hypothetical protein HYU22_01970 [Candidatus Woesearchaeota archaeon]|nr:hypothetical protein [Candidatus Woesearchaeota archaeon]